jgi:hypothetical protein
MHLINAMGIVFVSAERSTLILVAVVLVSGFNNLEGFRDSLARKLIF